LIALIGQDNVVKCAKRPARTDMTRLQFGAQAAHFPSMKPTRILALAAFALPVLAQAHPGHDGHDGHELVWDFDHLVAHPVATVACFLVLAAGAATVWQFIRSRHAKEPRAGSRADTRR
jgi:hypothetical protein